VTEELTEDHREVEALFEQIQATAMNGGRRRELVYRMTIELVRHSVAEEEYLYSAVRRHVEGGAQLPLSDPCGPRATRVARLRAGFTPLRSRSPPWDGTGTFKGDPMALVAGLVLGRRGCCGGDLRQEGRPGGRARPREARRQP
jgi:hypothetical protein